MVPNFFFLLFSVYFRIQHLQKKREGTIHINTPDSLLNVLQRPGEWQADQAGLEFSRVALRKKEMEFE